jgi:hypothetical protein
MRIELITQEEHKFLLDTQKNFPNLTYQNTGYDYPDKSLWTEEDKQAFDKVVEILRRSVLGFSSFNHFKISKSGRIKIRLQYDWSAHDGGLPFTGVGYILVDELFKGFES